MVSRLALALLASTVLVPLQPVVAKAATATVKPLDGLKYRLIGPFRGGRATGVAGVAGDPKTFYFGAATGGLTFTRAGSFNVDKDGYLVAKGNFDEPIGPSWWGVRRGRSYSS